MKSLKMIAVLTVSLLIFSCESSIDNDARRLADLQCKIEKMAERNMNGESVDIEESMKLTEDANKLAEELRGKYNTQKDQEKFADAVQREMNKCK